MRTVQAIAIVPATVTETTRSMARFAATARHPATGAARRDPSLAGARKHLVQRSGHEAHRRVGMRKK